MLCDARAVTSARRGAVALGVLVVLVLTASVTTASAWASRAVREAGGKTVVTFTWGGGFANQLGALPAVPALRDAGHVLRALRPGLPALGRPRLHASAVPEPEPGAPDRGGRRRDRRAVGEPHPAQQASASRGETGDLRRPGQPDPVGLPRDRLRLPVRAGEPHAPEADAAVRLQLGAGYRPAARRRSVLDLPVCRNDPAGQSVRAAHTDRGVVGRHVLDTGHLREHRHRRPAERGRLDHLHRPRRLSPGLLPRRHGARAGHRPEMAARPDEHAG